MPLHYRLSCSNEAALQMSMMRALTTTNSETFVNTCVSYYISISYWETLWK